MRKTKSTRQAAEDAAAGLDAIARTTQSQLRAAAAIPQVIVEAYWAMASELLSFAGRRLQAQAELCRSLGRCQELGEAVDLQRQFGERVTRDYADEAGQLSEVIRRNIASLSAAGADLAAEAADKGRLAA